MSIRSFVPFVARRRPDYLYVPRDLVVGGGTRRRDPRSEEAFREVADEVMGQGRTLLGYDRLRVIWQAIENTHRLGLAAAEVGSFRGGSAYFIARSHQRLSDGEREVHIFDTFEGHPNHIDPARDTVHQVGHFKDTSYEEVARYLAPWKYLTIHKGDFESTSLRLPAIRFGFAHLDVDIYASTLHCLEYFGERLSPGGVMVVDDYGAPKCPGVDQAVRAFLSKERTYQTWHFGTEQIVLVKSPSA